MIGCWNVSGCNESTKVSEIRNLVFSNNLCLISILDTKVKEANKRKKTSENVATLVFLCSSCPKHNEEDLDGAGSSAMFGYHFALLGLIDSL